ncbi:putative leucine-rich repeat receptor-like protein kinase [Cucumis melo var. makuwa]|uniref:Leucine-rich repeat receptor-like protein kinase n=1 Tax=Cucumis melo var. makuwa TaxID=1194695 RepID=A0A5A7UB78_CUCMM|nr:putative leucine-rich repeat receptor-like protein kinase [Cucumis melo var. makuwa]
MSATVPRFLLPLLSASIFFHYISGQNPSGFISLDCGIPPNTSYTEQHTNINYESDAAFISTGTIHNISSVYLSNTLKQQLWSLRSFPNGVRNCYRVRVKSGTKYLIRASFLYGNYDDQNKLPGFDLYFGPNLWTSVTLDAKNTTEHLEIMHIVSSNWVEVCLVNTGTGTPFISALELRPLPIFLYETRSESLATFLRLDVGSATNLSYRNIVEENANYAEKDEESGDSSLFLACKSAETCENSAWYLDSGTSNHMCGSKSMFMELDKSVGGDIVFGDAKKIPVKGKGAETCENSAWYLDSGTSNHMCGSKSMFMELDKSVGGDIVFGDASKIPVQGKGKILINLKNGRHEFISNVYYVPNMKNNILSLGQLLEKDPNWIWHLRFGHLNFDGLRLLARKNMVKGLPYIKHPDQLCEGCLHGKQSSRKTWVYFVKEKSEVFDMFKRFKALVEKESGYYIKALRSDRGGEFTSNEFKTFCAENGIRRPMTVPFTPQQNGVVERKNRTILNMAQSMLKCKKMPKEFWTQVVECVVYLSNRSHTRSLWNKTPQQAWIGRKPSISHLRVFECIAYAHIPD